jgi:hypothetical protein
LFFEAELGLFACRRLHGALCRNLVFGIGHDAPYVVCASCPHSTQMAILVNGGLAKSYCL